MLLGLVPPGALQLLPSEVTQTSTHTWPFSSFKIRKKAMGRYLFFYLFIIMPLSDGCLLGALGTGTPFTPRVVLWTHRGGKPWDVVGTTLSPHMGAVGWQNKVFWDIPAC